MNDISAQQSLQQKFNSAQRVIEIGGPSPEGYGFIHALGLVLPNKITVTNMSNPIVLEPYGDNPTSYPVDEVVDIQNVDYDDQSVDVLLCSSFPKSLRPTLLEVAARVLKHDGLLVLENIYLEDCSTAASFGLKGLLSQEEFAVYHSQIFGRA